jgi:hypothetical protein
MTSKGSGLILKTVSVPVAQDGFALYTNTEKHPASVNLHAVGVQPFLSHAPIDNANYNDAAELTNSGLGEFLTLTVMPGESIYAYVPSGSSYSRVRIIASN